MADHTVNMQTLQTPRTPRDRDPLHPRISAIDDTAGRHLQKFDAARNRFPLKCREYQSAFLWLYSSISSSLLLRGHSFILSVHCVLSDFSNPQVASPLPPPALRPTPTWLHAASSHDFRHWLPARLSLAPLLSAPECLRPSIPAKLQRGGYMPPLGISSPLHRLRPSRIP
jgi:hypothetical protein